MEKNLNLIITDILEGIGPAATKGWDQGLIGMKAGGRRKLFVPTNLAYGEREKPKIPAFSNLIFEIELLEVRTRDNSS